MKSGFRSSNSIMLKKKQHKRKSKKYIYIPWKWNKWVFHINQANLKENNRNVSIRKEFSPNGLISLQIKVERV